MTRLATYLALEREMLLLERLGVALADAVRDAMDPIWYQLGPEERRFLDGRTIPEVLSELEPIRGRLVRVEMPARAEGLVETGSLRAVQWRCAA